MGTWGAALYDDDTANDLRNALAVVCKVPADGDRLLELLAAMYPQRDPADDDGALFWLVTADQFERRGIACRTVATTALSIIDQGTDLTAARARGADEGFLRQRSQVLDELARRLRAPRPLKPRPKAGRPPDAVLETGELFTFPTMSGWALHPHRLAVDPPFVADGWGALVVLATGRAFDWLPWCALAALTVAHDRKPSLDEAMGAKLLFHPQNDGAGLYVPKRAHARTMGLEPLGRVALDQAAVKPRLASMSVATAIQYGWTIAYAGLSSNARNPPIGCELASLLEP